MKGTKARIGVQNAAAMSRAIPCRNNARQIFDMTPDYRKVTTKVRSAMLKIAQKRTPMTTLSENQRTMVVAERIVTVAAAFDALMVTYELHKFSAPTMANQ